MSSNPTNLQQTIADVAAGPSRVVIDGQDVTAQPLTSLIAADEYLAKKAGAANPFKAMKDRRVVPGGMTGRGRR